MQKLTDIQNELKAPKNQYNSFGKYHYRSCEDILEGLKPLLNKHKCSLSLSDSIEVIGDRIYVKATATLTDGKESISTTSFAREPLSKKGMDEAQVTGSASSYARKYALNGLFLIDDTKDSDALPNDTKEVKNKPETKKKPDPKSEYRLKENLRKQIEAMITKTDSDRDALKKLFKVEHIYQLSETQHSKAMEMLVKKEQFLQLEDEIYAVSDLEQTDLLNQKIESVCKGNNKKMDELKKKLGDKIQELGAVI